MTIGAAARETADTPRRLSCIPHYPPSPSLPLLCPPRYRRQSGASARASFLEERRGWVVAERGCRILGERSGAVAEGAAALPLVSHAAPPGTRGPRRAEVELWTKVAFFGRAQRRIRIEGHIIRRGGHLLKTTGGGGGVGGWGCGMKPSWTTIKNTAVRV